MVVVELLVEGDVWTRGWVELLIPQDDVMKEKLGNLQKRKPLQSNIYHERQQMQVLLKLRKIWAEARSHAQLNANGPATPANCIFAWSCNEVKLSYHNKISLST